jgi:hypothetical protein
VNGTVDSSLLGLFEPVACLEEFRPRTSWSLSNAFTSAFKDLEPIPQFRATAKLGEFLEGSRKLFERVRRCWPDRRSFITRITRFCR